ncbi:hypothetical protein F5Y17DRAFT_462446 [Xylariaceae sp. FL0594]|nr:hypothetical protein F5Y17DRAFT_462446 [Xylariaceae sp. FL0594]
MADTDNAKSDSAPNGEYPKPITLRPPSKYATNSSNPKANTAEPFIAPSNEWLWNTWTVTHSTLSMWESAQNVRITYTPHKSHDASKGDNAKPSVNDNIVEYEKKNGKGGVHTVVGIEKPDPNIPGSWNWRGKGLLAIASSHWEILGWGERPVPSGGGTERWAVTWFAPTLFTEEGIDIYSDRKEGLRAETVKQIIEALKQLEVPRFVELVEKRMKKVAINLPWKRG